MGFTLTELLVVLAITSIVTVSTLQLFQRCIFFTNQLRQRTAQTSELNYCLDRMITEITDSVSSNAKLNLIKRNNNILGGIELIEYSEPDESSSTAEEIRRLEWVIAADDNNANSIYRKDYNKLDDDGLDMYYPVCDRIAEFEIIIINGEGLEDPNATAPLMQFNVESYINDTSEETFSAYRTFCLRRGELLGVPDLDKIQDRIDEIIEEKDNKRNSRRNVASPR